MSVKFPNFVSRETEDILKSPKLDDNELVGNSVRHRPHKVFFDKSKFILYRNRNIYPIEWVENGKLVKHQKFIVQRRVIESHPEYWRDKHFGKTLSSRDIFYSIFVRNVLFNLLINFDFCPKV